MLWLPGKRVWDEVKTCCALSGVMPGRAVTRVRCDGDSCDGETVHLCDVSDARIR